MTELIHQSAHLVSRVRAINFGDMRVCYSGSYLLDESNKEVSQLFHRTGSNRKLIMKLT
jgi:hypothetical protein